MKIQDLMEVSEIVQSYKKSFGDEDFRILMMDPETAMLQKMFHVSKNSLDSRNLQDPAEISVFQKIAKIKDFSANHTRLGQ